jgi:hypothetical protein
MAEGHEAKLDVLLHGGVNTTLPFHRDAEPSRHPPQVELSAHWMLTNSKGVEIIPITHCVLRLA